MNFLRCELVIDQLLNNNMKSGTQAFLESDVYKFVVRVYESYDLEKNEREKVHSNICPKKIHFPNRKIVHLSCLFSTNVYVVNSSTTEM